MSILAFQMPEKVAMEKADDFRGLFTFKPLEKGYGVTIGNALRRILLSSLEGYAITGVKIPSVLHEFSTIEGVVQDVSEIILNLKEVRFSIAEKEDVVLTLEKSGEGPVTAGDISESGFFGRSAAFPRRWFHSMDRSATVKAGRRSNS